MKKSISTKIASVGVKCIETVAVNGTARGCVLFFYQPKTPKNIIERLKKH